MRALRAEQWRHDNAEPEPEISDAEAELAWIDNAAQELLEGKNVQFQRRLCGTQGVTFDQFAVAVDEFVMSQLGNSGVSPSVLGRLVLAAKRKDVSEARGAADEAIGCADPTEALLEIARKLVRPLACDGLIAQAEDAEL